MMSHYLNIIMTKEQAIAKDAEDGIKLMMKVKLMKLSYDLYS